MKDLEYQAEKEARPETNLRSVVLEEYHNLLDVFSKKNSNTLLPHREYNHKTILKKQQKLVMPRHIKCHLKNLM